MSGSEVSVASVAKHAIDGRRSAVPLLDLRAELLATFGRDTVIARAAIVLARAPLGADPPAAHHGLEGRVERTLIDVEDVLGDLAQLEGESPAVHGLLAQEREGEHLERAPHDLGAGPRAKIGGHALLDNQKEKRVGRSAETVWPIPGQR